MYTYSPIYDQDGNLRSILRSDGVSFGLDPNSSEYQRFLKDNNGINPFPLTGTQTFNSLGLTTANQQGTQVVRVDFTSASTGWVAFRPAYVFAQNSNARLALNADF